MAPRKSTAEEVSFVWSHHRISSTDSKVRTTLHVSVIEGCPILRQIFAWHCIVLTSSKNSVQKHNNKKTKHNSKKFNNAMHKFVGVLDKCAGAIVA